MTIPLESRRIVIAGASSLFGAELKALLEESRFAACDFRLVDEEIVAGTLTEAGGEAAVIQPVEDDSFHKAWAVFFTGSPAFTKRNLRLAQRSGAVIVDLSGELAGTSGARSWLPKFETAASQNSRKDDVLYVVPAAPPEITARPAARASRPPYLHHKSETRHNPDLRKRCGTFRHPVRSRRNHRAPGHGAP